MDAVELLGPPTLMSKAWHAAFTVLRFLATFGGFRDAPLSLPGQ
jgi:hypothetical protein